MTNEKIMPLLGHLKEFRLRLIRVFVVTILIFFFCYFFRADLLQLIKEPVEEPLKKYSNISRETTIKISDTQGLLNCSCEAPALSVITEQTSISLDCICSPKIKNNNKSTLVFIGLPEIFFTELKISFFLALFFAFPYCIAEIWGFVFPALHKKEKKIFWGFIPATFLFFTGGAMFGYFVVFPIGFDFFLSLTKPEEIVPFLSIGQYVSFAIKLLFAFGIVFEFPLVVLFLSRLGLVSPKFMIKNTKYAVVLVFIFSAILTPPDPFTMFLMAIPLSVLYILSIAICFFAFNKRQAALKEQGLL